MHYNSTSSSSQSQTAQKSDTNYQEAENLFQKALALHQEGDAEQALLWYQKTLSIHPEHIEACFFQALLYEQMQEPDKALQLLEIAHKNAPSEPSVTYQIGVVNFSCGNIHASIDWFEKTLQIVPQHWQAAYNLGAAYFAIDKTAKAIDAYQVAAKENPQEADIHFNLGLALKKAGMLEGALQSYLSAMEIAPNDHELHYNLAIVQKEMRCEEEAINSLEIAISLNPNYAQAYGNLGKLYMENEKPDKAITCYQKLIDLDHNSDAARHILAALKGETTDTAPLSYVKELFDDFSSKFDKRLVEDLQYRTPWELAELLNETKEDKKTYHRLLDLGCGTGLSGQVFHQLAAAKTGIDLSPKMLQVAEEKKIYDTLLATDLLSYLEKTEEQFDLIIACDVFIYLGDLKRIFQLLKTHLSVNGKILFSTENLQGQGYNLRASGRYAHSPSYIADLVQENGFEIQATKNTNLRKEKDKWVNGDIYMLGIMQK